MNKWDIASLLAVIILLTAAILAVVTDDRVSSTATILSDHKCVPIGVDNGLTVYQCDDGLRREDDVKARK